MRARPFATLLLLLALVLRVAAPDAGMASIYGESSSTGVVKCKLHASANGANEQAPPGDAHHDHSSCAFCQLGWTSAPAAGFIFAVQRRESHLAAPASPPAPRLAFRLNLAAPTRGPPSHA